MCHLKCFAPEDWKSEMISSRKSNLLVVLRCQNQRQCANTSSIRSSICFSNENMRGQVGDQILL